MILEPTETPYQHWHGRFATDLPPGRVTRLAWRVHGPQCPDGTSKRKID